MSPARNQSMFATVVHRSLRPEQTVRSVLQEQRLPLTSYRNMRDAKTMPSAEQIATMAAAFAIPPSTLTRALLHDRGYDLGAELPRDMAELGALAHELPQDRRHLLLRISELLRASPE